MTLKRAAIAASAAALVTLMLTQPIDAEARLSLRMWIALTALGLGGLFLHELLSRLPVRDGPPGHHLMQPARTRRRWWRRRRLLVPSGTAMGLRTTAVMVSGATERARTHDVRLRPRLTEIADHMVPRRTIDPEARTRELVEAAGDTGWLIDPAVVDRAPTIAEIDRFLDHMLGAEQQQ